MERVRGVPIELALTPQLVEYGTKVSLALMQDDTELLSVGTFFGGSSTTPRGQVTCGQDLLRGETFHPADLAAGLVTKRVVTPSLTQDPPRCS